VGAGASAPPPVTLCGMTVTWTVGVLLPPLVENILELDRGHGSSFDAFRSLSCDGRSAAADARL
jgi:hypothetical protein